MWLGLVAAAFLYGQEDLASITDFKLTIGSLSETVRVTADTVTLNTENGMVTGFDYSRAGLRGVSFPPAFADGNSGRNILDGPGMQNIDLSLLKNWAPATSVRRSRTAAGGRGDIQMSNSDAIRAHG